MGEVANHYGRINEDGTFSILARITSLGGTGTEVKPGEGNCLKQADIAAIQCKVFDLGTDRDATSGTEITPAPTVTTASNIFDTLRTVGWPTGDDPHGYNFRHDIGVAFQADPGEWRAFEYRFTLTDGGVAWLKVRVYTEPVLYS